MAKGLLAGRKSNVETWAPTMLLLNLQKFCCGGGDMNEMKE
jgi:hypothetical protein